jgi:uncharacterized 2Fe-2S/4Fe-4S cluster protein (DUF4445 family)
MGMRAASRAIAQVKVREDRLECRVIGNGVPRGICGSGLVDAVAAGLDLGWIAANGRLKGHGSELRLVPTVSITQADIRELQLAKAAVAAGMRILADRWGVPVRDIRTVHLAGAFGNYVKVDSACRIGLLESDPARILPAGNAALRGVKMALLRPSQRSAWLAGIRSRVEHVSLASDPHFQEIFVECLTFDS